MKGEVSVGKRYLLDLNKESVKYNENADNEEQQIEIEAESIDGMASHTAHTKHENAVHQ